jgi:predicted neutral ceramidase superfamily lipid hydrolase
MEFELKDEQESLTELLELLMKSKLIVVTILFSIAAIVALGVILKIRLSLERMMYYIIAIILLSQLAGITG